MTDLDARYRTRSGHGGYRESRNGTPGRYGYYSPDSPDYRDYGDDRDDGHYSDDEDYGDYGDYGDQLGMVDRRWRGVALTAGLVLLAAVITTVVILTGGGDGGTAGTVATSPRTVIATVPPPSATAPAKTTASAPPATTTRAPAATSTVSPAPSATTGVPAADPASPYTVTYTVTGTKSLLDLVTIVYTDEQGFPHTDVNPALPWTRRVTLNPGVTIRSITATSLRSKLNCSITDGAGQLVAVAANDSIIATCTR